MSIQKKLFDSFELPALTALFGAAGLQFVDIGGRDSAFYPLLTLAPFAHYVSCEPDAGEAARLKEALPREAPWRGVTVIEEAIATRRGLSSLHLTRAAGMSSLLPPDGAVAGRTHMAGKFAVVSVSEVPTIPLDDAARRYAFEDATFLKLDTQGSELDILQSGDRLVRESLVGVHTELWFQPFYTGQPLFADVDAHLRARGFSLFTLSRTALRRAGYRPALYSKRMVAWAHCLYMREPATLLQASDPLRQLSRLLAVALAFQQFDVAFEVVGLLGSRDLVPSDEVTRLDADVEQCAVAATRQARYKASQLKTDDEAVLAASYRDRGRLE
jgi:FkbM family methyltransferase